MITTSHAADAARTIQRFINMVHPYFRESARGRIADVLVAVVAQRLSRGATRASASSAPK